MTEADELDKACCRGFQTVATTTTPLAALPSVTYVDGAGEPVVVSGAWLFRLGNGGRSIEFGYSRGTIMILR